MHAIQEATNRILWSLWSELGIPGGARMHSHLLLDPEPLIVCTPHLGAADPRLLGLVFDWCAAHADILFKSRIKAIAHTFSEGVQHDLARFNGALSQHGIDWSPVGPPGPLTMSRKTVALPLERPSLLRLRMRALTGVSARSEVLTALLTTRQKALSADEMTVAGITRRSTDRVIAELLQGNFLAVHGKKRGRRFALADRPAFVALFAHGPDDSTCIPIDWRRLLHAVVQINTLPGLKRLAGALRRVEAAEIRDELASLMNALHQGQPPIISGRPDAFGQLIDWATVRIGEWSYGKSRF